MKPAIDAFLRQRPDETTDAPRTVAALAALAAAAEAPPTPDGGHG